jgi:hypothetical protein
MSEHYFELNLLTVIYSSKIAAEIPKLTKIH